MCFLYILPWLHEKRFLNAFCNVISELVIALSRLALALYFHSCYRSASGLFPAGCLASVCQKRVGRRAFAFRTSADEIRRTNYQIAQGRRTFAGSRWRSVPDRSEVPGMVPGRGENTKKMYAKSETASKPSRFELGKSEKSRRNLKLIQTCDFFIFVHYVYNSL